MAVVLQLDDDPAASARARQDIAQQWNALAVVLRREPAPDVDGGKTFAGGVPDLQVDAGHLHQVAVVEHGDLVVGGLLDVDLDVVRALVECELDRRHRVLRRRGGGAAVGDDDDFGVSAHAAQEIEADRAGDEGDDQQRPHRAAEGEAEGSCRDEFVGVRQACAHRVAAASQKPVEAHDEECERRRVPPADQEIRHQPESEEAPACSRGSIARCPAHRVRRGVRGRRWRPAERTRAPRHRHPTG